MTDIPKGYKQTEVGVIPEDWEVKTLGKLGSFSKGQGIRKKEATSGNLPCIRYGEIYTHHNDIIRSYNSYISPIVARTSRRLSKGDILFAGSGETKEEIGKAVAFVGDAEVYAGGDIVILSQQSEWPEYLGYLLNTPLASRQKASVGQGDAVVHISASALGGVAVPLPPLPEQRAIAGALSDVDALLAGLDRLIAKKRDLKQAAMQQLLTGQTRLPGFEGEWEPLNMAQDSTLKARIGWQGLTTAEYLESGQYALVTGTDFFDGKIDWDGCNFVEKERYDQDRYIQLQINDVLLTKDGTIGKAAFVDNLPYPATLNSGVFVIRPKNGSYVPKYFFYVLRSQMFVDFINKLQAGSTISHLYQKDFVNFEFIAPLTVEEQAAIASVLSDMDAEIEALEQRRAKTADIKQAMMQELLTGRTRLV